MIYHITDSILSIKSYFLVSNNYHIFIALVIKVLYIYKSMKLYYQFCGVFLYHYNGGVRRLWLFVRKSAHFKKN